MAEREEIDKILRSIEGKKLSENLEEQRELGQSPTMDSLKHAEDKRREKVQSFQLELDLPDDTADQLQPVSEASQIHESGSPIAPETGENIVHPVETEAEEATEDEPKKKRSGRSGCLKKVLYVGFILALSLLVTYFIFVFIIDAVGLNKSDKQIDIEIPNGASTQQIAAILNENGIIDQPFCFRIFSKLTKSDGKYQRGTFALSADMGYSDIVDLLQTSTPRETVTVTIPEGYTVEQIARLMEENNICDKSSFYEAVVSGEYDYDFVKAIPTSAQGAQYSGRIYRLEGYLFPDTYNFYVGSSGETVVKRFLENFDKKLTPSLRAQITETGWTIDQAITFASIVQGEAAKQEDMLGVSRVLHNRLEPGSGFPKLQCDATTKYVTTILPSIGGIEVTSIAYDTYEREGLPVGAINNPGLNALQAALNPSEDPAIAEAYYFATDFRTNTTYFSKTLAQHEATCRIYKIGMYK